MKIFQCGHCNGELLFQNHECENCSQIAGYYDKEQVMFTFHYKNNILTTDQNQRAFKFCKNKSIEVCNWLLDLDDEHEYCIACRLNRTTPKQTEIDDFAKWKKLEISKHRLIYQLQKIGLPLPQIIEQNVGLRFDFISQKKNKNSLTGHSEGLITILLKEADSLEREKARRKFSEAYRTLIGHLRHEIGHYFWDELIRNQPEKLEEFRKLFGDESLDYQIALDKYYNSDPPENWQKSFISRYSTSHPWEDWAESWAHYLHVMDMVETAYFFGIEVKNQKYDNAIEPPFDPYFINDFDRIIKAFSPISFAVNSINRTMGMPRVYPFKITDAITEKIKFIHQLLLPFRK